MEIRRLGRTDLMVSRLALGTMTFGKQVDAGEAARIVDRCLDSGVNFIDTANVYTGGASETILGQALRGRRHQVVVASKVGFRTGDDPDDEGLSRPAIRKAINGTLKRLGTDYLDLYYLHLPDRSSPIEETLAVMEELVQEGKVRHPAVSNYASWQVVGLLWHCDNHGYTPPTVAQQMYNLVARGLEDEYIACSREFGLGMVVYNPLAGGLLTGKYRGTRQPASGTRFDGNQLYLDRYWHAAFFDAVEDLVDAAAEAGLTLPELALRWLLAQPHVDSVILGASSFSQFEENIEACQGPPPDQATVSLCDAVWSKLRGVSPRYNR